MKTHNWIFNLMLLILAPSAIAKDTNAELSRKASIKIDMDMTVRV